MLQFGTTLYFATTRHTLRSSWRFTALVASNSSTAVTGEQAAASVKEDESPKYPDVPKNVLPKEEQRRFRETGSRVDVGLSAISENKFTQRFQSAESVNDLLDVAMLPNLSVPNALKLISRITNEINSGKSQMINIETDRRFIRLRKMVKTEESAWTDEKISSDDLSRYTQLSTPAMIAVIASLREQGKRNTPLLRMLSYNIVKYNVKLNVKQCATLLYSMAVLNFPDKVLLEKIMADLLQCLPRSTSAVTNKSIVTSLGFLRYKNEDVLDTFCDTLFDESINYKLQGYSSILQTFAALRYESQKASSFIEDFAQRANPFRVSAAEWLDIVWSFTILGSVRQWHLESVLDPTFTARLSASTRLNVSRKLKLLNINAFARFQQKDYKGPFLTDDSVVFKDVPLIRAKAKQAYIDALSETLKKLFPSADYYKIDIDTNMGFLLDAEYRTDNQHGPIPIENWDQQSENVKRIGIMMHDYHDYCRGQNDDLLGSVYLYTRLLKARGYDLLTISYENFSIQDKLEKRMNYLKQCMKNVQERKST